MTACVPILAAAAAAQEPPAPAEPPAEPATDVVAEFPPKGLVITPIGPPLWTMQIEPMAWWASPSGKVRLPATSGTGGSSGGGFADSGDKVRVETLNLDTPRLGAAGQLHLNAEKFRFTFGGAENSISRDRTTVEEEFRLGAVEVAAGDELSVGFHLTAVETTIGYQIWGRDFRSCSEQTGNCVQADLRVYAVGGFRFTDFSLDVERLTGASASAGVDEFYVEPILGLRFEAELAEQFFIDAEISGGYYADADRSAASIDVALGFVWRPQPNVGVQIGWRQLAVSLSDGDDSPATSAFEFDGRVAGVFAGIVIRF